MAKIKNNRWVTAEDVFATRIEFPDLKGSFKPGGFFQRLFKLFGTEVLVVEPGTRAWFVCDGHVVGHLDPGQHTVQSCIEKLNIFKVKQATVVLCRGEDQRFGFTLADIPTRDGVLVDMDLRLTIQMEEDGLGMFAESFLGTKPELTVDELRNQLLPMVMQSIKQGIAVTPTQELVGGQAVEGISATVVEQLSIRMKRYGLRFVQTEVANVRSEAILDRLQHKGKLWEREQDIQDNVRRLEIKSKLRDQHLSDAFDKIETKDEYEAFVDEVDTRKLLRTDEKEKLVFEFENNKEDRESLRSHMVSLLDMERDFELDSLNSDYEHRLNIRSLDQELELAKLTRTGESDKLVSFLEQRKTKVEARREEQRGDWQDWRDKQTVKRDEEWDNIVHERRVLDVQGDIAIAEAENTSQVALIENEMKLRIETQNFELEKSRKEWELEVGRQESDNQLDKLARLNDLNADFAQRQADIEDGQADRQSQRELDKINALSNASTEAVLATSDTANAEIIAKATSGEEVLKVKLDAEQQKNEAVADVYKQMVQSQKDVLSAVTGATTTPAPAAPAPQPAAPAPPPAAPAPPPGATASSKWFLARDGQSHGPYTQQDLASYISSGNVTASDQICKEGSSAWMAANSAPEFQQMFGAAPPPPPPPPMS